MINYKKLIKRVDERVFKNDGITSKSDQQFLKFELLLGIMIPATARLLDCVVRNKLEGHEQAEKDRIKLDTIYFKCTTTLPSHIDFDKYAGEVIMLGSKYSFNCDNPDMEKLIL